MRLRASTTRRKIYDFCQTRPTGTTPAEVTEYLAVPPKAASDHLTHMAMDGDLRRVRLPNRSRKQYRYFPNIGEVQGVKRESFGLYEGTPIEQMPLVNLTNL